jgi:hypothetical protein
MVLVFEPPERAPYRYIAEIARPVEPVDARAKPLPHAQGAPFELDLIAPFEQRMGGPVYDALAGVGQRARVEVDLAREI